MSSALSERKVDRITPLVTDCFSLCATTMVASSSMISTERPSRSSSGIPATSDARSVCPLASARCAQVISRATAPAAAMPSISAGLIEFSTRQHVESEATGPNTSP
jgi:hypothetical protein